MIRLYESEKKLKVCWCFVGIDQSNLRVLYGGFSEYQNTYAYYLNPWSGMTKEEELNAFADALKLKLEGKSVRFILYARVYEIYRLQIIDKIKSIFPQSALYLYYGDLAEKHAFNPFASKEVFDAVFTFDKKQAWKYGFHFLQEPLSSIDRTVSEEILYDVVFVGEAKDRLELILDIYEYLKSNRFTCRFFVNRVEDRFQKYSDEIAYNCWMDYRDLIDLDKRSYAILEVMQDQENAYSPTTRWAEALLLNRKLITNCIELKDDKDEHIIYFSEASDIDLGRIRKKIEKDYHTVYEEKFSVPEMIKNIGKILGGE